jgi:hypothetical protein
MDKVKSDVQDVAVEEQQHENIDVQTSPEGGRGSCGSHSRHSGCGMHGGWMRWVWIGILGYFIVSYFLR